MVNSRFNYIILSAFVLGTALLVILQFNSSENMTALVRGNENLLGELKTSNHLREIDRDIMGVESRIRAAIATDDTSHLEGIDLKVNAVRAYLDSLSGLNTEPKVNKLLGRLNYLAEEKVMTKNHLMKLYAQTGGMNDTTSIGNPQARQTSDEITAATQNIYASRQKLMADLSDNIKERGVKAKVYGNVLIGLLMLCGASLCWFIINQFRLQNRLITKLDISERKAREALQVKENFLANMSHEIRTPLNAILGYTSLLKRKELENDAKEFVRSMQVAGENLLVIINDILDLSKIESGMMRIVSSPFSVRGLLHSIETLFRERIREKGLEISCRVEGDIPDTLVGDATRLTQILVNLIGNAVKFSEHGQIIIRVYGKVNADQKINLHFKVSDQGIGIDELKLEKIFDRFNQADDSITRNYGGTGLGLAIVRNLIQIQNGDITVKSEPGSGAEFDFFIPYTIADDQLSVAFHPAVLSIENMLSEPVRILVVDDNYMNQDLMKHLLSQWDFSFDIVSNGLEALHKMKELSYDMVLMDIQMPVMDGYTAAEQIRNELGSDVPIIAMTAHAMAGEREKCLSYGMNEYLSKPVSEENLHMMITRFVKPGAVVKPGVVTQQRHYQYLDLGYVKEVSRGNISYEKKVTSQFIDFMPANLSALKDSLKNSDFKQISQVAHNLKTSVAIMGLMPHVGLILDQLESFPEHNPDLAMLIEELQEISTIAVAEATHFLQRLEE